MRLIFKLNFSLYFVVLSRMGQLVVLQKKAIRKKDSMSLLCAFSYC